jgi:flavin reductase (DIM6/NTAB) family NADH-FMN oxidoreductase RutF
MNQLIYKLLRHVDSTIPRNLGLNTTERSGVLDPLDLRRAFGRFGTGVTVITTRAPDGARLGLTANSFNTVSLDPPIVLWSLSGKSPSLDGFHSAGRFVVNVLAHDQLELSHRFARPSPDKFAGLEFTDGLGGVPVLKGCVATIECSIVNAQGVGDHVLFLGQVERFAHDDAAPLLFCDGRYLHGVGLHASAKPDCVPASMAG